MIDHDVDIETDELVDAKQRLEAADHVVGDVPTLLEAEERLLEALGDLSDQESFEDRLTAALVHVRSAESLTNSYRSYLTEQHQQGRVRVSNVEWLHVDACLIDAADAANRWIDYAEHELRSIS